MWGLAEKFVKKIARSANWQRNSYQETTSKEIYKLKKYNDFFFPTKLFGHQFTNTLERQQDGVPWTLYLQLEEFYILVYNSV
jgi:hypothetical protein